MFWASATITALFDESKELIGFAKITRDLTERKRAQEMQKALEARDEFLSIASHELRTPLTALKLQQQVFERQVARAPSTGLEISLAKQIIELTGRQVTQLTRLIEDMLDVSRISTGRLQLHLEKNSLSEVVARVFEMFVLQFQAAGIQASVEIENDITATFDSSRIVQVISNLLSNAIRYGKAAPVNLTLRRQGHNAEIIVKDHGAGVDPKDHVRIFLRYERAASSRDVSGLGLGLFICRQIAELHGGSIRVESEVGKGSSFIVTLPL
jgi:signal transduction histidine kinase